MPYEGEDCHAKEELDRNDARRYSERKGRYEAETEDNPHDFIEFEDDGRNNSWRKKEMVSAHKILFPQGPQMQEMEGIHKVMQWNDGMMFNRKLGSQRPQDDAAGAPRDRMGRGQLRPDACGATTPRHCVSQPGSRSGTPHGSPSESPVTSPRRRRPPKSPRDAVPCGADSLAPTRSGMVCRSQPGSPRQGKDQELKSARSQYDMHQSSHPHHHDAARHALASPSMTSSFFALFAPKDKRGKDSPKHSPSPPVSSHRTQPLSPSLSSSVLGDWLRTKLPSFSVSGPDDSDLASDLLLSSAPAAPNPGPDADALAAPVDVSDYCSLPAFALPHRDASPVPSSPRNRPPASPPLTAASIAQSQTASSAPLSPRTTSGSSSPTPSSRMGASRAAGAGGISPRSGPGSSCGSPNSAVVAVSPRVNGSSRPVPQAPLLTISEDANRGSRDDDCLASAWASKEEDKVAKAGGHLRRHSATPSPFAGQCRPPSDMLDAVGKSQLLNAVSKEGDLLRYKGLFKGWVEAHVQLIGPPNRAHTLRICTGTKEKHVAVSGLCVSNFGDHSGRWTFTLQRPDKAKIEFAAKTKDELLAWIAVFPTLPF